MSFLDRDASILKKIDIFAVYHYHILFLDFKSYEAEAVQGSEGRGVSSADPIDLINFHQKWVVDQV